MGSDHRAAWDVKGGQVLPELTDIMKLTAEESAALAALRPAAEAYIKDLGTVFYERLTNHPNTNQFLEGVSIERQYDLLGSWWLSLFSGKYDDEFATKQYTIGVVHVRLGLPVRYPLAMIDIVGEGGATIAAKAANPELAQRAFAKVTAMAVALFNQSYENNQLHHLSEIVGNERLARRALMGEVA